MLTLATAGVVSVMALTSAARMGLPALKLWGKLTPAKGPRTQQSQGQPKGQIVKFFGGHGASTAA